MLFLKLCEGCAQSNFTVMAPWSQSRVKVVELVIYAAAQLKRTRSFLSKCFLSTLKIFAYFKKNQDDVHAIKM